MSRWAATSTTRWRGPGGRVDHAERVEVEDGVVQRHRHLVLGLEAHGGGELLAVGDRRQLERAQDRALVGDADAHALAQPAVAEQLAQRLAERAPRRATSPSRTVSAGSGSGGRALGEDRAVDARLHGGDVARLDVEADDVGAAERRPSLSWGWVGRACRGFAERDARRRPHDTGLSARQATRCFRVAGQ